VNNGNIENGATIKGAVAIGAGSVIRSGAYIEGPAIIGEHCDVGPNCYIRPYTSIGDFCRIGHAVEIKNSIVMDHCHIAHLSYIGDSVVGYNCNLGAGTITANVRHDGEAVSSFIKGRKFVTGRKKLGAILADGVKTGVHTSIYPGRKIWPNLTTRPGAVVDRDIVSASET
jgi:NDP-sugar pyrophosphorylase family protein